MTMPQHRTLVARLIRHYRKADALTIAQGRQWYTKARTVAEYLSEKYGYTLEQTAYVIAALSPNVSWKQNVKAAEYACQGHRAGVAPREWQGPGYGINKVKAHTILTGNEGWRNALSGPKVTEFAKGILGEPDACTVDVWMQRAVAMDPGRAPKVTEHRAIRKAIDAAARKCGEPVRDFQAIVWTQVRGSAA